MMEKRRVVLLCAQNLLGESMQHLLSHLEDVEILAVWSLADPVLPGLVEQLPDLLLIADEEPFRDQVACLTAQIIEACPDLPVVRVTLDQNVLHIFTAQTLPARSAELLEMIHRLPLRTKKSGDETPAEQATRRPAGSAARRTKRVE